MSSKRHHPSRRVNEDTRPSYHLHYNAQEHVISLAYMKLTVSKKRIKNSKTKNIIRIYIKVKTVFLNFALFPKYNFLLQIDTNFTLIQLLALL